MAAPLLTIDFAVPVTVAKNDRSSIRLFLYGTGASLTNIAVYVIPPRGQAINITSIFTDVSSSFPATFLSQFDAEYTFQQIGLYVFIVHDSSSGDVWVDKTFCSQWASNMDAPVSNFSRQRSDIQRIYGKIK